LGQPTLPVYRIQWHPTSELVALDRDFGDTYSAAAGVENSVSRKTLIGLILFFIAFSAIVRFYNLSQENSHSKPDRSIVQLQEAAKAEISTRFSLTLPDASFRFEQSGKSMDFYIQKKDLETIDFPDRKQFVERLAKPWCEQVDGKIFKIRDIRTGEILANYGCHWWNSF
jgi:hypothetical protein